jgi:phosphoribosyl 1,2-cyclic phosphate phosphodiesterase
VNLIDNKPFFIGDIQVVPIEVLHYRLPVLGFRINDFAYITDANYIDQIELDKLKGVKYLVLNALRRETHISHFTLDEATHIALQIGAEHTYFTHMSHQIGFHDDVCNELPDGIDLAFDGQILEW